MVEYETKAHFLSFFLLLLFFFKNKTIIFVEYVSMRNRFMYRLRRPYGHDKAGDISGVEDSKQVMNLSLFSYE